MKKRSIFSVLIVIILFTVSFTGCFSDDNSNKDNDGSKRTGYQLYYECWTKCNETGEYFIYLPYPDGWANFIEDIKIDKGEIEYKRINTDNGSALEIKSKSEFHFTVNKIFSEHPDINFDLLNESNENLQFKIFFSTSFQNQTVTLGLSYSPSSLDERQGGYSYDIYETLKSDWNYYYITLGSSGG